MCSGIVYSYFVEIIHVKININLKAFNANLKFDLPNYGMQ